MTTTTKPMTAERNGIFIQIVKTRHGVGPGSSIRWTVTIMDRSGLQSIIPAWQIHGEAHARQLANAAWRLAVRDDLTATQIRRQVQAGELDAAA